MPNVCPSGETDEPIRYFNGEIRLSATDLDSAGFGLPWGQTRSYTNQLASDYNFGNGYNWIARQQPALGENSDGIVYVILGFNNVRFFAPAGGGTYAPMNGANDTLVYDSGTDLFTYISREGAKWVFFGFDTPGTPQGLLKSFATRVGNEVDLAYSGNQLVEASRLFGSSPDKTLKFVYEYLDSMDPNAGLLAAVTLRKQIGSDPEIDIKRVTYTYHTGTANGSLGDLKQAMVEVFTDSGPLMTALNYYRYYVDDAGGIGIVHGLRYVLNTKSWSQLVLATDEFDPDLVTDEVLAEYADYYFEYDPSTRNVVLERVDGGTRETGLEYQERTSPADEDYNYWQVKTVETRPDGAQVTVYTNYVGGVLLKVLSDGTDTWCNYYQYDDDGRVILHAEPSAVISYDDSAPDLGISLRSSDGLLHVYSYYDTDSATAAKGYMQFEAVMKGTGGTPSKLREWEYGTQTAGDVTVRPVTKQTVYRNDDNTGGIETSFTESYYSGTVQPEQRITTLPKVPTAQNGENANAEIWEYFDEFGNVTAIKDERGYYTVQQYDPASHQLIRKVEDADSDLPPGWPISGTHLNLTTDYELDDLGRTVEVLGPAHDVNGTTVRTATWTVYQEFVVPTEGITAVGLYNDVWSTQGYLAGSTYYLTTPAAPVSITRLDSDGNTIAQFVSERDPGRSSAKLSPDENYADQARWVSCTVNVYDDASSLVATQVYYDIPSSGIGSVGVNYDQTDYLYDAMERRCGVRSAAGTITRTIFDVRGLAQEIWVGTNDHGFDASFNFDSTGTNNLVKVTTLVYDGGSDGGDGNLTQQTQHVDASSGNDRVTDFTYDYRDRRIETDGPLDFFQEVFYDNLNRVIKTERRDSSISGNLIARSETAYDDRGRVYQTKQYGVDPSTGTVGNSLVDNTWYDASGNTIKSLPAGSQLFTKTIYDGVNRATAQYQGYYTGSGSESYSDAGQVTSSNTIYAQTVTTFDDASEVTFVQGYQRFHDATGSGVLNGPGGSQPKARISYQAMWCDGIGRSIATADYGTNGNTAPTRPSSPPSSSSSVLVSQTDYDAGGRPTTATDPAGMFTQTTYDDAGRVTQTVQDYGTGQLNLTTSMTYHASGQVLTLTATNADTGNQVTTYTYGTTLTDSAIASNDLLSQRQWPEGGVTSYTYNRQQQRTTLTDPNTTVHAYDYDKLGRQTADRVTTVGSGGGTIDTSVLRIEQAYEVRGMVSLVTSYDAASSGSVVNQVQLDYNNFGQLTTDYQAHGGTVYTSTTPKVQYAYANGSANTIRRTQATYPNGTVLAYGYGSSGGAGDRLSRIEELTWNGTSVADYSYLGLGSFVRADYGQPQIRWDLITGSGSNPYAGLDAFGRTINCFWQKYSGTPSSLVNLNYGYNLASNRVWRQDTVAPSGGFDELYTYDSAQRLLKLERGDLNGGHTAISNQTLEQDWTLDKTGNWKSFTQDAPGTTDDVAQTRTSNEDNQITGITTTVGTTWPTPVYDDAGNMIQMPNAANVGSTRSVQYDPWGRLTYASSTPGNYTSYSYDGLNRRTLKTIHIGATGIVRHYYHSDQWQVLEERMSTSTNANIQYVWGQRYVDDMVLRERDTTGSGTLDERLYAMQDANWNVVAICDTSAAVQERYVYAGYGMQSFLTASYAPSTSSYIWIYLFTGREWEAEIGLLYCRNRHYHPLLGAWTQKDPIGYDGGDVNLYRYVLNNPGNLTDASGLENINKSITVPIYDIDRSHTDSKWQIATLTLTLSIGDSISRCKSNCGGTCTGSMGARLFFDWKPTPGANQSHAPEDNGTFWITDGIKRENIRTNPKTNRPFARYDFGRQPCAGFTIKKRLEVSGTLKDHPNITWPYYVIQVEATVEPCGNVTRESITIDISDYLFDKGNKSPND